ncbi:MAG: hypothetical protein AB7M05_09300 [Alphaproteobacteria bacterium]
MKAISNVVFATTALLCAYLAWLLFNGGRGRFEPQIPLSVAFLVVAVALAACLFVRFRYRRQAAVVAGGALIAFSMAGFFVAISGLTLPETLAVIFTPEADTQPQTATAANPPPARPLPAPPANWPPQAEKKPFRLEYTVVGTAVGVMPADQTAKPTDGGSFLGSSFTASGPKAKLQVHVVANAYSPTKNDIILAIFRENQTQPLWIRSKPVEADGRVVFDEAFEALADEKGVLVLDVRLGIGRTGVAKINGPDGNLPPDVPRPYLEIKELE